ncbi:MAG: hypothetical protein NTV86_10325 [Planctomycetota bacterium]|nr:hypothetical protein [Planctomycetota bacterium]
MNTLTTRGPAVWLTVLGSVLAIASEPANAFYHPGTGRWLQRDPVGYKDGMNLYQYVNSRPATTSDPSGQLSAATLVGTANSVRLLKGTLDAGPCFCGPDVTPALVAHLSEYLAAEIKPDNSLMVANIRAMGETARRNGHAGAFGEAIKAYNGSCGTGPCKGTVTFCGHCISEYHMDHLLVTVYISKRYGMPIAHMAGRWHERGNLGDLAINQAGQAIFSALVPMFGEPGTLDDVCASVEDVMKRDGMWATAQLKESKGRAGPYGQCQPCKDVLAAPPKLEMPK